MAKPLHELTARERDERWTHAHQQQIANRKKQLERDMSPREAERQASRMQESATNRARAMTEGKG